MKLTKRQQQLLAQLPATTDELADAFGVSPSTIYDYTSNLSNEGIIAKRGKKWVSVRDNNLPANDEPLSAIVVDEDPNPTDLSGRERMITEQLKTGATKEAIAEELGERPLIIDAYLRDLKQRGWEIYKDDTTNEFVIEGDHALRSSEHTGTRTRKANRWWEKRNNELVREYKHLESPQAPLPANHSEDWILHITDVHAGDFVRTEYGDIIYDTSTTKSIIDYITERSIVLSQIHGMDYDVAHILYGGDMVTNEAIYSGQFEDLDAWLDEQVNLMIDAMVAQIKTHAEHFAAVNVVCQVGNHGQMRASGTSKQANADLILYKSVRNVIAHLQNHDVATNVNFVMGEARPYRNFTLRGGGLRGHLRHGNNRKPYAGTAAGSRDWSNTLLDHDFDVAFMGHHHVSGRLPWDGPPVFISGTPKPPGDFVDKIAHRIESDPDVSPRDIATCVSVADHGTTAAYPVRTHKFSYVKQ